MNSVCLVGRLTRDPEVAYTANTQTAVCKFSIAINRPKKNGEDAGADYPRITVWGRQAENCGRYLHKGDRVGISGRIETGSYTDRDGKTVYTTDVVASNVEFLSEKGENRPVDGRNYEGGGNARSYENEAANRGFGDIPDSFQVAEDDIPF